MASIVFEASILSLLWCGLCDQYVILAFHARPTYEGLITVFFVAVIQVLTLALVFKALVSRQVSLPILATKLNGAFCAESDVRCRRRRGTDWGRSGLGV